MSTKESTQAIAMDYANADPTLATKTSVWSFFVPNMFPCVVSNCVVV